VVVHRTNNSPAVTTSAARLRFRRAEQIVRHRGSRSGRPSAR
jgi:hypothetical protein